MTEESQIDPETLRVVIARELTGARQRTSLLTDSVDEADLVRQHSPLMSPLVWDLAHIANAEELWLLREVGGREPMHPEIDPLYDAFEHPRSERPTLPLLPPAEARAYGHEVRGRVLDLLDRASFTGTRLLGDGFAFGMIAQHEVQHDETMLITHQIRAGAPVLAAVSPGPAPADAFRLPSEVLVPGGPFTMGTSTEPWALDNERPAHIVDVAPFYLDTTPVTCSAYTEFIEDGGYDDPRWWTPAGWKHRQKAGLTAPLYWRRDGGQWTRRVFGRQEPVTPDEPVLHVCWYEADAYARWAGRRLPTEAEWEKAARFDPAAGLTRRYPWGNAEPQSWHANLGQGFLRPAPAGSYPDGAAPCGARQLIGDVWEWTSSDFLPYPGFKAWPYREYSEVFFGPEYKVLRGGSFAVSPVACRGTFRNWDYPIRRQIFSGFRTARSALPPRGTPPGPPGRRRPDVPAPGLPRTARDAAFGAHRPAARPVHAVLGAAPAAVRDGERGWVRGRLVRAGRPGPGQVPASGSDLGGRALRRHRPGDQGGRGARGGAQRDGGHRPGHRRGRAVHVRSLAVQPQRGAGGLAGIRRRAGRHPAARCTARPRGQGRFGPAVGAGAAPARARRGPGAGPGGYRPGATRGGHGRPVQLPADRRPGDRGHRGGRHLVVPVRACGLVCAGRLGAW